MANIKETNDELNKLNNNLEKLKINAHTLSTFKTIENNDGAISIKNMSDAVDVLNSRLNKLSSEIKGDPFNFSTESAIKGLNDINKAIDVIDGRYEQLHHNLETYTQNLAAGKAEGNSDRVELAENNLALNKKGYEQLNNIVLTLKNNLASLSGEMSNNMMDVPDKLANKFNEVNKRVEQLGDNLTNIKVPKEITSTNVADKLTPSMNNVQKIEKLYGSLSNNVRKVTEDTKKFGETHKETNKVANSVEKVAKSADKTSDSFNKLKNTGSKAVVVIKSSFLELLGAFTLIEKGLKTLFDNKFLDSGKKLINSITRLNADIGSSGADNVIEWAKAIQEVADVDLGSLLDQVDKFALRLEGIGLSSDKATRAAQNLALVANNMARSGIYGGDTDKIADKLAEAFNGREEQAKKLGLNLSKDNMQAYLEKLQEAHKELQGLSIDFSKLNERQQAFIKYAYIMNETKYGTNMEPLINGFDSVTGRIQRMQNAWNRFVQTVGVAVMNMAARIGSILAPALDFVTSKLQNLMGRLGFDTSVNSNINGTAEMFKSVGDKALKAQNNIKKATDDTTKSLEKQQKAVSGNLQGFDKLNVLTSNNNEESTNLNADNALTEIPGLEDLLDIEPIDFSDTFKDAAEQFELNADTIKNGWNKLINTLGDKWEEFKPKLIKGLNDGTQAFEDWAGGVTDRSDFDLGFNWDKIINNIEKQLKIIDKIFKTSGIFYVTLSLKVLDDLDIGQLVTDISDFITKLLNLVSVVQDVMFPAIQNFYDVALAPIVSWIGDTLSEIIQWLSEQLDKLADWFIKNATLIQNTIATIAETISILWGILEPILSLLVDILKGVLSEAINHTLDLAIDFLNMLDGILKAINSTIKIVYDLVTGNFDALNSDISEFIEGTGQAVTGFLDGIVDCLALPFKLILGSVTGIFENIGETIDGSFTDISKNISDWFNGTLKDVKGFASDIITGAFDAMKLAFNKLGGWLDDLGDAIIKPFKDAKKGISDWWDELTDKTNKAESNVIVTSVPSAGSYAISHHAGGGHAEPGELFYANETGAELISNWTGRAGADIANQGQLSQAMEIAFYNAMAMIENQRNSGNNNRQDVNINISGNDVLSAQFLRYLARLLSPYITSNNRNISNISFNR